jgi:hypothetical protein
MMVAACLLLWLAAPAAAYGPLAHAFVVYQTRQVTLERLGAWFPREKLNEQEMLHFAIAGALLHDVGYVREELLPLSDRLHYLANGEFLDNLLGRALAGDRRDARVAAFALSALLHYAGDRGGHYTATNRASAALLGVTDLLGSRLAYADNPDCHSCIEKELDAATPAPLSNKELAEFLMIVEGFAGRFLKQDGPLQIVANPLFEALRLTYRVEALIIKAPGLSNAAYLALLAAYDSLAAQIGAAIETAEQVYGRKFPFAELPFLRDLARKAMSLRCPLPSAAIRAELQGSRNLADSLTQSARIYERHARTARPPAPPAVSGTLKLKELFAASSAWDAKDRPPDINLDTNQLAGVGEYPLADKALADLRSEWRKAGAGDAAFCLALRAGGPGPPGGLFLRGVRTGAPPVGEELAKLDHLKQLDEQASDTPEPRLDPVLAASLPVGNRTQAQCNTGKLHKVPLGAGRTAWVGKDPALICLDPDASVLEVWIAANAAKGALKKQALPSLYLENLYSYGRNEALIQSAVKTASQRCPVRKP